MSLTKSPAVRPSTPRPTFRSGAVARMAGMPVATLRIWEQRYQAVQPATAASGHRQYCGADVERVTLLRRLTQQGHAIGLLAPLELEQLHDLISTPVAGLTPATAPSHTRQAPLRIVVVGLGMAGRLKRLVISQTLGHEPQWVGRFNSLADAAQAAKGWTGARVDLLLWQATGVQTGVLDELRAVQNAWQAHTVAVAYRFANAGALAELVNAKITVAREPADDKSLGQWLASLALEAQAGAVSESVEEHAPAPWSLDPLGDLNGTVSAPRFDEAALTAFAGLSTGIACECPSHLAELVLQLSSFENYSAGCASRHVDDAQLHAYLQRVAGVARMLFEKALERVAVAEGLALPLPPANNNSAASDSPLGS